MHSMVLRINPSKFPVWRSPTELQIGLEATAPRFKDLTRAQERLIQMLYRGMPNTYIKEASGNLAIPNPQEIIDKVQPVLMQVSFPQVDEDFVTRNFAEICRVQATYNHSGESIIAQRKTRTVYISDNSKCGKLISDALTNSGIGQTDTRQSEECDFAILIGNLVLPPTSYNHWLNSLTPHIAVVFDQDGVTVSPVIETGKTPCLTCFHEQQIAKDSAWPEIASQLLFSEQKFDDSTCQLFAAAIASQRSLDTVDELASFIVQDRNRIGYRLNVRSGTVSEFSWEFSSKCLCQKR
jgi:hypothetical protein